MNGRDSESEEPLTWEQILQVCRDLASRAEAERVPPADGAKLVRMVLAFDDAIHRLRRKPRSVIPPAEPVAPPAQAMDGESR
jgi:hypothetical protein